MKRPLLTLACTLLASAGTAAPARSTFKYTPPAEDERPVITDALIAPQGSDFAMRLRFDKVPFGECKTRCANSTIFLDTDSNTTTGIQLGKDQAETGADMAVIVQGTRVYKGESSNSLLRVKVRQLTGETKDVEAGGEALADLDNAQDAERVQLDENTVYLLIDATGTTLPSGRKVRVIYHPPAAKAIQSSIAGMLNGGSSENVRIFRSGGGNSGSGTKANWSKTKEAGQRYTPAPALPPQPSGPSDAPARRKNPVNRSKDNG